MAKLSVYNTIDRSQLGGKFVPLIQSGVNNYKILASDLGKEYSPGDAIEITDTGVINVNYDPDTLRLSGSGLGVRTDSARGVFRGNNGIYIASADSSIGISNAGIYIQVADHSIGVGSHGIYLKTADNSISVHTNGIKVDPSALVGKGLSGDGGTLYVVSANDSIVVSEHGIKVNPWDGLGADSHGLYVEAADTTISVGSDGVKVRTGYGLIANDYGLCVRSADNSIYTSYAGIKVNPSAITGSGLVTTNGAIGVNVNTATGIIVKDNKLYLNSGDGLQTSNNAVSVKAADSTIYVGPGIGVNIAPYNYLYKSANGLAFDSDTLFNYLGSGAGLKLVDNSLYVKSANNTISVRPDGLSVYFGSGLITDSSGLLSAYIGSGLRFSSAGSIEANIPIPSAGQGLTTHGGDLSVKAADNSIGVYNDGVRVNVGSGLFVDSSGVSVNTGYGLSASSDLDGLGVKAANKSIGVSSHGIKVNLADNSIGVSGDGIYVNTSSLASTGLSGVGGSLYVLSADSSTVVQESGIRVKYGRGLKLDSSGAGLIVHLHSSLGFKSDGSIYTQSSSMTPSSIAGRGLSVIGETLYVNSADSSILVGTSGIKVNSESIAGHGLVADMSGANNKIHINIGSGLGTDNNGYLEVKTGDGLGVDSYGSIYAASSYTVGPGLTHSSGALEVLPANDSIVVSNDGIKVNPSALAGDGLYVGPSNGKLYVNTGLGTVLRNGYVDVNAPWVAHSGLAAIHSDSSRIVVKAADNTILVGGSGIRVNTDVISGGGAAASDLVGQGLVLGVDDTLYVKSADSSITVQPEGIRVNPGNGLLTGGSGVGLCVKSANDSILVGSTGISVNTMNIAGDGLGGANNTLYVNSAWLAGHGLMSNASGKLDINCGAGLALDTTRGSVYINCGDGLNTDNDGRLYVTSAVNPDFGKGLWLASDNNSLLSVYAGSGLTFDDQNRLSVYAGSGLEFDSTNPHSRIRVKAANSTISVGVSGISVNTGPGLAYLSGKLGVGVRNNSIGLSSSGIYVNSANNSLSTIDAGIKVNTMGLAGVGLGGAADSFYVMSADSSIEVSRDGIKVAEGFGLPDYSSGITVNQNTEYTADTNCWLYMWLHCGGQSSNDIIIKSIYIDGIEVLTLGSYVFNRIPVMIPCKKGSKYEFRNVLTGTGNYKLIVYKCLV